MPDWLRRDPAVGETVRLGDHDVPVVIRRLAHARRMTLRLAPDGSAVRISIPQWGATRDALVFVTARKAWLEAQFAALPRQTPPAADGSLRYRGTALRIDHTPSAPRRPVAGSDTIRVGGPAATLSQRLRRWLEAEARTTLSEDLAFYCDRAARPVPRLTLSNARRRWGSCATSGAIRINWRLIMAPDTVRRSVVAHEVAHLVHFDHSPRFHALLADLFEGDLSCANRWLKREGRSLYAPFG